MSTGAQDVADLDSIASDEDFAMTKQVVIYHAGSHHGDDDPVLADDAAAGGLGEGELVCATFLRGRGSPKQEDV